MKCTLIAFEPLFHPIVKISFDRTLIRVWEQITYIRNTTIIKIKLAQYADDTTIFLQDIDSLHSLLKFLDSFGRIFGLKINLDRMEVMWLGSLKNCNKKPLGLKCSKQVKALGIYFSYDKKVQVNLNFKNVIQEIFQIINMWKQRNLK